MEGIFTEGIDPFIPVEVMLSGLGSRSLGTTLTVFIQITNINSGGKGGSRNWGGGGGVVIFKA